MIQEFLETWHLFKDAYLSGIFLALALSLTGIFLVAREQIFLGVAIAQASMFGVACCFAVGALVSTHLEDYDLYFALGFAIIASWITSGTSHQEKGKHEVLTGWIFLVGASGSYLLVNHSPHGTEEIQNLLFATIIGAEPRDVWLSLGLVTSLLGGLYFLTRPLLLTTLNPRFARSIGIPVKLYSTLFSIWLGLMIGYSLVVSGLLFTFACLILPALIAKNLAKAITPVFFITPVIAVVVTFLSFVIAHHYNLPPGHVVTLSLAVLFTISGFIPKKTSPSRSA